jgi:thymidine phosphorylase
VGERVDAGQPLLELLTDDESRLAGVLRLLEDAIELGDRAPEPRPLILERIGPPEGADAPSARR